VELQLRMPAVPNSVRVLAADSSGASEDRRGRTGTAGCIRSCKYVGVDDKAP